MSLGPAIYVTLEDWNKKNWQMQKARSLLDVLVYIFCVSNETSRTARQRNDTITSINCIVSQHCTCTYTYTYNIRDTNNEIL